MTRRKVICAFCVAAAAALYIYARSATSLYLLCASVFLPCASLALGALSAGKTGLSLFIPAAMRKGEQVQCALRFVSRSQVPIACVEAAIQAHNTLTGRQALFPLAFPAAPHETKDVAFTFESAHCGQYVFACDTFVVYDVLGLHGFRRHVGILEKRVATPELFGLQVTLTGAESPPGGGEVFSVQRKGQDYTEPFQIRDYAEGDSLKQIHWKLTQKLDRYIVTDPSLELELALLLLWDGGARTDGLSPRVPDALAEAFVSACIALAEDSVPYSVAWINGETGDITLKDVGSMEDLYDVVPGIMCAGGVGGADGGSGGHSGGPGGRRGGGSIVPAFLEKYETKRYPMTAYFAYQAVSVPEGARLDRLAQFLCVDGAISGSVGGIGGNIGDAALDDSCVVFTPDNYKNVLRDIVI